MSLDNVLAMAGAAKGHMWMLIAGLVFTVPGHPLRQRAADEADGALPGLRERSSAALIGWVSGEMIISDPAIKDWVDTNMHSLHTIAPIVCAALVIDAGMPAGAQRGSRNKGPDIAP